jgi:hypothetical protein
MTERRNSLPWDMAKRNSPDMAERNNLDMAERNNLDMGERNSLDMAEHSSLHMAERSLDMPQRSSPQWDMAMVGDTAQRDIETIMIITTEQRPVHLELRT